MDAVAERPNPTQRSTIQRKPAFVSRARPSNRNPNASYNTSVQDPEGGLKENELSKQERENLADYLNLGMSVTEARKSFRMEVEAAELRVKIRENRRSQQRGDIGSSSRTTVGNITNSGRGRGGLSFN